MRVTIIDHRESDTCTWCEKDRECVDTTFDDGFLREAPLCWGCLQKAVRVRAKRDRAPATEHDRD